MSSFPDPYLRIRSLPSTAAEDICACAGEPPIILVARLTPNPFACFACNGEVPPERVGGEPTLVDDIAAWRNVYDAVYRLWLDSREHEGFALQQLIGAASPLNLRGLALVKALSSRAQVYYWWHDDGTLEGHCPRCGGPTVLSGRHLVCTSCHVIVDPPVGAG